MGDVRVVHRGVGGSGAAAAGAAGPRRLSRAICREPLQCPFRCLPGPAAVAPFFSRNVAPEPNPKLEFFATPLTYQRFRPNALAEALWTFHGTHYHHH